jgi:DNA-binding NtrC family response regulator
MSEKKRILIVDDDPAQCEILSQLVSELGYEAFSSTDGDMALQVFKERNFQLVITDIKMPHMDGLTLLQKIRKINHDVRVIVLTGYPSSETILKTIENDGYTYLVKPVKLQAMAALIEKAFSDPADGE